MLLQDPPEDEVVTLCGHVFCYQCVSDHLTGDDNMCPAPDCREQLIPDVVLSKATLRSCISDGHDNNPLSSSAFSEKSVILQNEYNSSKIRAAIEILLSHCKSKGPSPEPQNLDPCNGNSLSLGKVCPEPQIKGPIKAIVFSQWTGMLDLVEISLNRSCMQYRRLDGTMSLAARDRAVKEFNTDPEGSALLAATLKIVGEEVGQLTKVALMMLHLMMRAKGNLYCDYCNKPRHRKGLFGGFMVTVMLMSLKAGNLGLNMVAACQVILLDLWWNPTTEDQAVDRAHRIGQTRPVTVSRLTIKNTVEDRILALQVCIFY
ncbi:unnamed protein product [Ilex paraguariensis]|uniref:Helicase C-terminal domain-containing protein n=1 Tax=Ilex paraguariensis TaxID=185542 RepID=A0ABC8T0R3_9AQUA